MLRKRRIVKALTDKEFENFKDKLFRQKEKTWDEIIDDLKHDAREEDQDFIDIVESLKPHHWVQFLILDFRIGQTGYIRVMV